MSLGKETGVKIDDWSQRTLYSYSFTGSIIFCRRSKGGEPKWTMFVTDAGEVRVYDYLGIHQPAHDIALGYTPDDAWINNLDTPLIAIKNGTTIRVFEEGSELFNTGAIANLRYINISNNYLHDTVGALGVEWRSLVDGSVITTEALSMTTTNIWEVQPTEAGETIYTGYRDSSGSQLGRLVKVNRTLGVQWAKWYQTGGTVNYIRCAGDGSVVVARLHGGGWSTARVYNSAGAQLNNYQPSASFTIALAAQPDGAYCAWAKIGTTMARIIKDDGSEVNLVLAANIVSNKDACDIVLGGYISFACINGNIYIYDSDGNLKATIDYGLAATPIAAVVK